jgi:hypothetical protein
MWSYNHETALGSKRAGGLVHAPRFGAVFLRDFADFGAVMFAQAVRTALSAALLSARGKCIQVQPLLPQ